ncbi:MAG: transcription termination/antitermination protein NusA [Candidatus Omnitrophica bacterium]|nr:transcription termination/antitermination protein NusA [Candidatus Omnitrophota bacterium]
MDTNELMTILEQLERDKGIDKEILISAVEAAVASAARKILSVEEEDEVKVVLNRKTGKLKAYAGDQEIRSSEFGRIAAQTAKQVVIQKIREAEKDVVYTEYQGRIGQIISGSVYRFEKGNIIIDLGKTEGCLLRSEQSPKEEFKQGDRVRAYVLNATRETKGPQIILSRAHPNFVKRLFELEVPEIYEGIVEVKSIARAAGERTKISVYSKDDKVDCVGACVGMRGSRVKNIVTELQGERIDIVRYSEDIKEYIQAALSPAEISQIQVKSDEKKANLIVAEDQLSLAIGKRGQNVRLASELVGWDLNIFTAEQWKKHLDGLLGGSGPIIDKLPVKVDDVQSIGLQDLPGVGEKLLEALKEAGFESLEKIASATVEQLTVVKGLGEAKAEKIIAKAQALLKKD